MVSDYMGAIGKQSYKEYLKSDHWLSLRLSVLIQTDGVCCICLIRDISNDVHHIFYCKSWTETLAHHLVCVCRKCHKNVHEELALYPEGKNKSEKYDTWYKIRDKLRKESDAYFEIRKSNPTIMKFANKKPDHNHYLESIGLPIKTNLKEIEILSLVCRKIRLNIADPEKVGLDIFIKTSGDISYKNGLDRSIGESAAKRYLTEIGRSA